MRILIFIFFFFLAWCAISFAIDITGNEIGNKLWSLFIIALSGIIGYVVGTVKSFREEKQKSYGEILPPILKVAYNPNDENDEVEKEFNKALSKLWLYGSKRVTQKMELALKIMHGSSGEDITKALQEAIVEMRNDIQLWSCHRIAPKDVNHLYSRIAGNTTKSPPL